MPPILDSSDGESSSGDAIPYHTKDEARADANGDEDDESAVGEEADEEEEVYVVERIDGHQFDKKGKIQYQVKWKGYDKPSDMTLEPEENLIDGAQEVLNEYFKKIGGRPEKQTKKRKSLGEKPASTPDKPPTKKGRKSEPVDDANELQDDEAKEWYPTSKDWDKELDCVSTIVRDAATDTLFGYLEWKNGKRSKAFVETCYEHCPQKMLRFYEQHLVFKDQ